MSVPTTQRIWTLAQMPTGSTDDDTFSLETRPLPDLQPDQVLVQVDYLSNDPVTRHRIEALSIGSPVTCWGVGTVLKSTSSSWKDGDRVFGMMAWFDYGVIDAAAIKHRAADLEGKAYASLSPLGVSALTAHQAMVDVLKVKAGQNVLVTAAAGSVGSAAVQIATIAGARVVGIAGGAEKCAWVKSLGAAECVDYKSPTFGEDLAAALPDGADAYLDMVGGSIFDTALLNMAMHGHIGIIGAVSTYNGNKVPFDNMLEFPLRRLTLHGFTVFDYMDKAEAVYAQIAEWSRAGKWAASETVVGAPIERVPETWRGLFAGVNKGKLVTKVLHE